ncbi:MAG TPA: GxxExxY protein [Terriglobales bacterium]|nr:GxxExxY protein [Terriglobales bacterium]
MKHEELTQRIIGVFYTIYHDLGHGFLESIYQKAFTVVLKEQGFTFQEQMPIRISYRVSIWASSAPIWWWTQSFSSS